MEICDDLLKDTTKRNKDVGQGSSNIESSIEYIPSHLKRQHETLTEYKVARHYIDNVINASTRKNEFKSACETSRSDSANKVDRTVCAIKCNKKWPITKTIKKQNNVLKTRLANKENIDVKCNGSHIMNTTTKLNKRCYDVRLAKPFNDRKTKQSECLCVLEKVRASFV
ncbi:uncharacterized protein LOC126838831 [Adelges cooleyi]|uniref:uncharacterized protein LOC126838831 n=1 Tax=Adelges cooleyi TaxID=133065 RepID=UPI00217F446E|nr:uncharacterized protein LOC126838831 [Adelges cooleyi]XP_050429530.1 uncharacterized protein LOC126838831 [Adelges cooleyi]